MNKSAYPIFGLREMSWPKGDGYLYLALPGKTEGRPLVNFDLYKTRSEEFREILKKILPRILAQENIPCYELENFSVTAEFVFREVAAEFGLSSLAIAE